MKISIITVCFNSVSTIEDTIKSVLSQKQVELEYIIIDGRSSDGTLAIIDKYKDHISVVVSEKDGGIYDAMNKGIKMATGEIVGILNSDDFYYNDNVLAEVASVFSDKKVDACYGDLRYIDRIDTGKVVRFWKSGEFKKNKLRSGWIMPHPAFFVRKELYNKFGLFDLDFRIAADYELMLRFVNKNIVIKYLPKILVCMREGGFSGSSLKQRKKGWNELKSAWLKNNIKVPYFFIFRRLFFKLKQYIV